MSVDGTLTCLLNSPLFSNASKKITCVYTEFLTL